MVTQAELHKIMDFEPSTGMLVWKYCKEKSNLWNAKYPGRYVGSVFEAEHGALYYRAKINGRNLLVHRLIWLYLYGYMPEVIDHKDDNGLNNRPWNLREATHSQNQANRNRPAIDKVGSKFRAKICAGYQQCHLGMFDTYEQALAAYRTAAGSLWGEFAYHNRPMGG